VHCEKTPVSLGTPIEVSLFFIGEDAIPALLFVQGDADGNIAPLLVRLFPGLPLGAPAGPAVVSSTAVVLYLGTAGGYSGGALNPTES
jgi:hypothetical protein